MTVLSDFATGLIAPAAELIGKFVADKDEANKLAHELATMADKHQHELQKAQIETNKEAAKHPSMFVAGARPGTMWICNLGLLYAVFIGPILDIWYAVPEIDTATLLTILGGLLGFGTMRMGEKINGVARENMRG